MIAIKTSETPHLRENDRRENEQDETNLRQQRRQPAVAVVDAVVVIVDAAGSRVVVVAMRLDLRAVHAPSRTLHRFVTALARDHPA